MYAGAVCTAAHFRDKDDYVNASIGGALAGSVFGIKCELSMLGVLPSNLKFNVSRVECCLATLFFN